MSLHAKQRSEIPALELVDKVRGMLPDIEPVRITVSVRNGVALADGWGTEVTPTTAGSSGDPLISAKIESSNR